MKNIFSIWQGRSSTGPGFEELVAPHIERLYRLAYRFTGNRHDAEDLVQELLVKLYPRVRELKKIEKLGPWLAKSLYHLFIDQSRRAANSPVSLLEDVNMEMEAAASTSAEPSESLTREQSLTEIEQALFSLSANHRALIALHDIEGYSLPELESILDTPLGTLKSRLHRARANLRKQLIEKKVKSHSDKRKNHT